MTFGLLAIQFYYFDTCYFIILCLFLKKQNSYLRLKIISYKLIRNKIQKMENKGIENENDLRNYNFIYLKIK